MSYFIIEQHGKTIVGVKIFETLQDLTEFAKSRMDYFRTKYNEVWVKDISGYMRLDGEEPNENNYYSKYETENKRFVYPYISLYLITPEKNNFISEFSRGLS